MDKEKILLDALNTFGNLTSVEQEFNYNQLEVIYEAMNQVLHIAPVGDSLLQSLHQDLKGFQDMGFLTPDANMGLGIAIEQVERYMRGELEARQQ